MHVSQVLEASSSPPADTHVNCWGTNGNESGLLCSGSQRGVPSMHLRFESITRGQLAKQNLGRLSIPKRYFQADEGTAELRYR